MSKRPRPPREFKRAVAAPDEAVASRVLVRRSNPLQAELFVTSFIPPCKPTLRLKAPTGERWQYEVKHDGYRAQCHVSNGRVRIYTKSGLDYATRLPGIVAALEKLPVDSAVIDGEAVMNGPDGITDFFTLHAALSNKSAPDAFLYAFDLLSLEGGDLRALPLDERRLLLEDLLVGAPPAIVFSEHVLDEDGPRVARAACQLGLEGVVAKLRDAPYRSGYSETWLKIKCTRLGVFVVTGYEPDGRLGTRSLKIAERSSGALVTAGSVGSGLTVALGREIRTRVDGGEEVLIQVEFRGRTPTGGLRHGAVQKLIERDEA